MNRSRFAFVAIVAGLLALVPAAGQQNPVTNGSFEELRPDGTPADWEFVGETVAATDAAAHSGKRHPAVPAPVSRAAADLSFSPCQAGRSCTHCTT